MGVMQSDITAEAGVIRCLVADLRNAVAAAATVIERRNTIPVLGCLHIVPGKDELMISGTNLDAWLTVRCPAHAAKAEPFCLPAPVLKALLSGAALEDEVTIRREKDVLTFQIGPVTARLRDLIPGADWPAPPQVEGVPVQVGEAALVKLIDSVRFAISTEETRYYLNGIFVTGVNGRLAGVATDGHKLARYCSAEPWDFPGVIFPRTTVAALRWRLVPGGNRTVSVAVEAPANRMSIAGDGWSMVCKTIDGTFPDYGRVIPARVDDPGYAILSRETLLRLPDPASDGSRAIKLDLENAKALVRDVLFSLDVAMPIEARGRFSIGFNGKYLRQIARAFGTLRIEATSPGDAAHILTDDPDLTVVLMPMRV